MSTDVILIQIRSLEAQLEMIRADLKQTGEARKPFAEFFGVLKGIVETTEQEVEAVKLTIKAEPV
ncbi:MAG: hypothetical protein HY872_14630 [Chloroflexi bacterium]|nr:hypothetical protein [Chloroflexota bacterium]MBI4314774.1 hypothetical protein [Chloroflexota bacterium]MBI5293107.1 hypothetical protein [Chloroflexota bacterium]